MELDFNLEVTGFETPEINLLPEERRASDDVLAEIAPVPDPAVLVVSVSGDLWHLGYNRVLCGNARSSRDFETVMEGHVADAGFTDLHRRNYDCARALRKMCQV